MDIQSKKVMKIAVPVIIVIAVIVVLANSFAVVEAGHTGVVLTFGKVNEGILQEGIHFKVPFAQEVVMIDNRILKLEVNTEAFSKDLQTVTTTLAINYKVDPTRSNSIYKNIGPAYEDVLITPAVNEVLKAITANYTAAESVVNRALISDGLIAGLSEKLNGQGITITDVNIINFDFSEAFINAIEEKQVAEQKKLKAETDKETAITNAQAEAETIRIKANAEAEANRILSESLDEIILEYSKIEKWDGKLPQVLTGDSGNLLIDVPAAD